MITRNNSKITIDNKERLINIKELSDYLPDDMSAEYKDKFVDEVIFRISDLEFDRIDTNGKTIEEYYFAACLAYAEENGFSQFFNEEDDLKIFDYCGTEL